MFFVFLWCDNNDDVLKNIMEREIKFRGINRNGKILIGDLITFGSDSFIFPFDVQFSKIIIRIDNELMQPVIDLKYKVEKVGEFVCKDKNGSDVWSNSKVKYCGKVYKLKYLTNGWYIDDISYPNFDEKDIEVVA